VRSQVPTRFGAAAWLFILAACASQAPFSLDDAIDRTTSHFGNDRAVFFRVGSTDRLTDSIQLWINDVHEDGERLAKVLSISGAKIGVGGPVPAKTRAVVQSALEQMSGSPDRGSEILVIGSLRGQDALQELAEKAHVKISFIDT